MHIAVFDWLKKRGGASGDVVLEWAAEPYRSVSLRLSRMVARVCKDAFSEQFMILEIDQSVFLDVRRLRVDVAGDRPRAIAALNALIWATHRGLQSARRRFEAEATPPSETWHLAHS